MGKRLIREMQPEIDKLKNKEFRDCVIDIMTEADDFIVDLPASTSGRYHPKDETLVGGNILHFRRVYIFTEELCKIHRCTKVEYDVMRASALLHDVFKCGIVPPKSKKVHSVADHMVIVYEYIKHYCINNKATISMDTMVMLKDVAVICLMHYGQWSCNAVFAINDKGVAQMSERLGVLCETFHTADCLASRRSLSDIMQLEKK